MATVEENMAQIAYHENMTEKLHANREELYQAYLDNRDETDNSRTLEGTSVEILGSVLNADGTADIFIGLDMVSANTCYLDAAQIHIPDGYRARCCRRWWYNVKVQPHRLKFVILSWMAMWSATFGDLHC